MASLVGNSTPYYAFLMGAVLALGIAEPIYGPRCGVPKIATRARQIVVGITYQIFGDYSVERKVITLSLLFARVQCCLCKKKKK